MIFKTYFGKKSSEGGKLAGVIPEVAYELEEINHMLDTTMTETGNTFSSDSTIGTASDEAKKVLEEASTIAEQKMNEIYPELPLPDGIHPNRENGSPWRAR